MARSRTVLLATCSLLMVLLGTEAGKKEETCDAIDDMAAAMERSLRAVYTTIGDYAVVCSANDDCDTVTCTDYLGQSQVEVLMCEDPPEVKFSITFTGGSSTSVTFDESTVKPFLGGSVTAVLDWDSHTEVLGLQLWLTSQSTSYTVVPYSEIPIDDSDCPTTNWALILGISIPVGLLLVAVVCCAITGGIWCCVRARRRRRATQFQQLTQAMEDPTF